MAASMPPHGPAPAGGTTLPALLLLIGKQCVNHVLMPVDSVADVIGKPSICCHAARNGRLEKVQLIWLFTFLSATDSNRWCLRGCRRRTLSGMDIAPELYLFGIWQFRCREPAWAAVRAWISAI
ncbi:hypothetical protein, partial [Xanthomonas dyei]|uniref:hypothetical protein n=1 Tax=Xanthomonas dyei TaxID=743699 RepID=UPI001E4A3669